jgi:hypothetical protein
MKDFKPKVACKIAKEAGHLLRMDPTAGGQLAEAERTNESTE